MTELMKSGSDVLNARNKAYEEQVDKTKQENNIRDKAIKAMEESLKVVVTTSQRHDNQITEMTNSLHRIERMLGNMMPQAHHVPARSNTLTPDVLQRQLELAMSATSQEKNNNMTSDVTGTPSVPNQDGRTI